jgi:hypothetical protein
MRPRPTLLTLVRRSLGCANPADMDSMSDVELRDLEETLDVWRRIVARRLERRGVPPPRSGVPDALWRGHRAE